MFRFIWVEQLLSAAHQSVGSQLWTWYTTPSENVHITLMVFKSVKLIKIVNWLGEIDGRNYNIMFSNELQRLRLVDSNVLSHQFRPTDEVNTSIPGSQCGRSNQQSVRQCHHQHHLFWKCHFLPSYAGVECYPQIKPLLRPLFNAHSCLEPQKIEIHVLLHTSPQFF